MTFHGQALVLTSEPYQYAEHLAKDLGLEFETEWSAGAGSIKLPDGLCDMHAWPEGLRLDAFADAHESLMRVEDLVKRHLERVRNGGKPKVEWYLRPMSSLS
ncbi:MAG TPA: DUF2218 domain-containing protein [Candidatus Binatia bacterium]|nr:DUF2218 domain-containing protein [Candidatus Binatia bacterium]